MEIVQNKHLKELWHLRFKKILKEEKRAFLFYRRLLKKNKELLEKAQAKVILDEVMRDELKHIRIAGALVRIVKRKDIENSKK